MRRLSTSSLFFEIIPTEIVGYPETRHTRRLELSVGYHTRTYYFRTLSSYLSTLTCSLSSVVLTLRIAQRVSFFLSSMYNRIVNK